MQLLMHLCNGGGDLNFMNITELVKNLTQPRDATQNPVTKFARDNKFEQQSIKAGLPAQTNL